MTEHDIRATGARPAGYGALIARFHLEVIPNRHHSFVATGNTHRTDTIAGMTAEVYPARYWPGDTLGDHLEFALKYDGINLAILASVFRAASVEDIRRGGGGTDRWGIVGLRSSRLAKQQMQPGAHSRRFAGRKSHVPCPQRPPISWPLARLGPSAEPSGYLRCSRRKARGVRPRRRVKSLVK